MSVTTTVPIVIPALLARCEALGLTAFEAWPGPDGAEPEMLILGEITWDEYAIATIKSGRKHRQENWDVAFELFVMGGDGTTPANCGPARERCFELLKIVENMLADDVTADTAFTVVQWVEIRPTAAGPRKFERGWAYRIAGLFTAQARLL